MEEMHPYCVKSEIYISDEEPDDDTYLSDEEQEFTTVPECVGCPHNKNCKVQMPTVGNVEALLPGEVRLVDVKAYFYLINENVLFYPYPSK